MCVNLALWRYKIDQMNLSVSTETNWVGSGILLSLADASLKQLINIHGETKTLVDIRSVFCLRRLNEMYSLKVLQTISMDCAVQRSNSTMVASKNPRVCIVFTKQQR